MAGRNFKSEYAKKLLDPRWQQKRLEILERDGNVCRLCGAKEWLQVHHLHYGKGLEPWEAANNHLQTLCRGCHEIETVWRPVALEQLKEVIADMRLGSEEMFELVKMLKEIQYQAGSGEIRSFHLNAVRKAFMPGECGLGSLDDELDRIEEMASRSREA